MSTWVIPGAPLEGGAGFRIWYSTDNPADFQPAPVQIRRRGNVEPAQSSWNLLPVLGGLERRMGVLTVTLDQPVPGGDTYEVSIPEAATAEPFRWKSLPDTIGTEGVSLLFASCFWRGSDKEGAYAAGVKDLTKMWAPAFKILAGDQVYTDWPISGASLQLGAQVAVEEYAQRYEEYWGDPVYRELMQTSPTYFACDDHEFWNDWPERQYHLARSWMGNHGFYSQAAQQLYLHFQRAANPGDQPWYAFRIGKVSFFVTDTRSQRDFHSSSKPCHFIQEPQWQDLERWVQGLDGPGVLVLGQPIYQKDGNWKDHSLSNFAADYGRLWNLIEASLRGQNAQGAPHDILVLSGDIHTGRYAVGRRAGLDAPEGVPELIASPAAMIRPGSKDPEYPPSRFDVRHNGVKSTWTVTVPGHPIPSISLHNNVGLVRMFPGTNGRIRFELSCYMIKEFGAGSYKLSKMFTHEIELR